jgi:hypothetical protein
MVHVSHTTIKRVTTITSYNMVPGIFRCGPVEHMSGPEKCHLLKIYRCIYSHFILIQIIK